MHIYQEENKVIIAEGKSQVWVEPWGKNSVRVRMTAQPKMDENDWALTETPEAVTPEITFETIDVTDPWYKGEEWAKYHQSGTQVTMVNGKLTVKISHEGWLSFYNQKGELLTEEYWRNRNRLNRYCVPLRVDARELKPLNGGTVAYLHELCREKVTAFLCYLCIKFCTIKVQGILFMIRS